MTQFSIADVRVSESVERCHIYGITQGCGGMDQAIARPVKGGKLSYSIVRRDMRKWRALASFPSEGVK